MAAALFFSSLVSVARSRFARLLLPRRVGNPLPTMHSLRVHEGPRACLPGGSFSPRQAATARGGRAPTLRVVRSSGRMVISGRMADVCAELDRLAAMESARA